MREHVELWILLRRWVAELIAAFFFVTFVWGGFLYQLCVMGRPRFPVPADGLEVPYWTKSGVCYVSKHEAFWLNDFFWLLTPAFLGLFVLSFTYSGKGTRYDSAERKEVPRKRWAMDDLSARRGGLYAVVLLAIYVTIWWLSRRH